MIKNDNRYFNIIERIVSLEWFKNNSMYDTKNYRVKEGKIPSLTRRLEMKLLIILSLSYCILIQDIPIIYACRSSISGFRISFYSASVKENLDFISLLNTSQSNFSTISDCLVKGTLS